MLVHKQFVYGLASGILIGLLLSKIYPYSYIYIILFSVFLILFEYFDLTKYF